MATKLLTLMYHRVHDPKNNLPTERFIQHFEQLCARYPIVSPQDKLQANRLNLCLTFDDAYFDFYHVVFPLLKKYKVKALLAIPSKFIVEKTSLPHQQRLSVPYPKGMDAHTAFTQIPFCTWKEIREMQQSGYVILASHGHNHHPLGSRQTDVFEEIVYSKNLIEKQTQEAIRYFIYPYGNLTRKVHEQIKKHYHLGFRIGSALNYTFFPKNQLMYRVNADAFWLNGVSLEKQLPKLERKYWFNQLRRK